MFNNENIEQLCIDGINYLRFKKLVEYNVNHCFVLNDLDFGYNFYDSLDIVCKHFNFNKEHFYKPKQTHSKNVKIVMENNIVENSDGLITDKVDTPIAIRTADCIPIIIFDKVKRIVATVHSGWRGTLNTIIVNAFNIFVKFYKSNVNDLLFFFGPSICQKCFEVDKDVKDLFLDKFKHFNNITRIIKRNKKKDKYYIDTVLLNVSILKHLGVPRKNIYLSKICTKCNSKYIHSYRARKKDEFGLGITIVSL